ncbi:4Fe-4S binding protein, partial [Paraburkholderia sp. SIMBA_061]
MPTVHSDACTGCGKCEKVCVLTGTRVALQLQGDGLINFRAFAITNIAAQPLKVETVFLVHQYRQPHPRVVDRFDL